MTVRIIGNNIIAGESSDTKPTNYATDTLFFELDTGAVFEWTGSAWTQRIPGINSANIFTNTNTITKTAEALAAEVLSQLKVSDDANSFIQFGNAVTTDAVFAPYILVRQNEVATSEGLRLVVEIGNLQDTGSVPAHRINLRKVDASALGTRPLFEIANADTPIFKVIPTGVDFLSKRLTNARFPDAALNLRDPGDQFSYSIRTSLITADKDITLPLLTSSDSFVFEAHSQTLTNKTIDADSNTITNIENADIKAAAAIAYSKLNLATSIVNADIAATAAIAYSKLALANSIVNADIAAAAAIAYSKLALTGSIVDGDIAASGITTRSKLPSAIAYEDEANTYTGTQTVNKTSQASTAETLQEWTVSDASSGGTVRLKNAVTTDAVFAPWYEFIQSSSTSQSSFLGTAYGPSTDSGTTPLWVYDTKTITAAAITTRPHVQWRNNAAAIMTLYASKLLFKDTFDLELGSTNGTKIGTATTQKLGFYNATPVVQGASIADVDAGTIDAIWDAPEQAILADLRTKVNSLISRLEATGLIATV